MQRKAILDLFSYLALLFLDLYSLALLFLLDLFSSLSSGVDAQLVKYSFSQGDKCSHWPSTRNIHLHLNRVY